MRGPSRPTPGLGVTDSTRHNNTRRKVNSRQLRKSNYTSTRSKGGEKVCPNLSFFSVDPHSHTESNRKNTKDERGGGAISVTMLRHKETRPLSRVCERLRPVRAGNLCTVNSLSIYLSVFLSVCLST
jgi:hypothetical protein